LNVLVTVFTVLAGFLIAIIAVLCDPLSLSPGSWRKAENQRDMVERKLIRHMWLFGFYLVIIGLIFLITLLRAAENVPNSIRTAVDFIFLWFGVAGFLFSLTLPKTLMDIQRDRVNAEIERRRREENIPPDT